ncbi:polysaccharide deacetylase family protein [Streptomyces sp. SS1-1]|uniref:polysaccharide deacetylase family protein n=1 Tax=Streptomyces sp. SS1-1 TaxID=2651869 RepID=UPI00124FD9CE|nr:polysaccharide deacetylase family protein [Streptomyces sp. SS1-1]KAB2974304.1 polysaccharide deacetylase family protein [Streptomyces sp. SS1-1]
MRLVGQNDKKGPLGIAGIAGSTGIAGIVSWGRPVVRAVRRARLRGAVAGLAVAAVASGCAQGAVSGPAGGSSPAAGPVPSRSAAPASPPDGTRTPGGTRAPDGRKPPSAQEAHAARVAAARRWRLARVPLVPPPPPEVKPRITTRKGFEVDGPDEPGLPPVFTTVPTNQKVVFLTIDDGAEKDPAFLRMMSDLKVPYSAFLSDYVIKDDYGYFRQLQRAGAGLNNHTLHHRYLPGLSYRGQQYEICGMQDVMEERFGERPVLFRPPFGNYNRDTLRAARSCGVRYVALWNEEVFVDRWDYREEDRRIRPGDIVLSHFRGRDEWKGTMPDMIRRFLDKVTAEGFAVARLEDYL